MEENSLIAENKMLRKEIVELYKKLKEAKCDNNLLLALVYDYMEDEFLLCNPASYAKKHLILN